MQAIFDCCHGALDTQAGKWLCSAQAADAGALDEEIIGEEGPLYKSHRAAEESPSTAGKFPSPFPGFPSIRTSSRGCPPAPISSVGPVEDEKETAKQRLKRLIRDFAHDAVGPGLEVTAQSLAFAGNNIAESGNEVEGRLRMDRRLSQLELWPPDVNESNVQDFAMLLAVPLRQVTSIAKGRTSNSAQLDPGSPRDSAALNVVRHSAPNLRLIFETPIARDRAYTCLRIFQMSMDRPFEQDTEPEIPGSGGDSPQGLQRPL